MEKIDIIQKAADKAKGVATSFEELSELIDEYMLRWYIYGDFEKREPCQLYELVSKKQTNRKKFPVKFLTTLIEHLTRCEKCYSEYSQSSGEKANE